MPGMDISGPLTPDRAPMPPSPPQKLQAPPALLIYPGDWLGDFEFIRFPADVRGNFFTVLLVEWKQVGLPSDHTKLAQLLGMDARSFATFWEKAGHYFELRDGRYYLPSNDIERARQAAKSQQASAAGKASARARGGVHPSSERATPVQPPLPTHVNGRSTNITEHNKASAASAREDRDQMSEERVLTRDDLDCIRDEVRQFAALDKVFGGTVLESESLASLYDKFSVFDKPMSRRKLLAEVSAALEGMHGPHVVRWEDVRANIDHYVLNPDETPSMARLRGYLYYTAAERVAEKRATRVASGADLSASLVAQIMGFITHNGRASYIPIGKVLELGPSIAKAYEDVGGASRFLNEKPGERGYLINDFAKALRAATGGSIPQSPSQPPEAS